MSKGGRFDSRRFIPIVPRRQQFAFSVSLPAASRFLRPHSSEQTSLHRHPSIDIAREQHSTSGRSLQCSLSLSFYHLSPYPVHSPVFLPRNRYRIRKREIMEKLLSRSFRTIRTCLY